MEELAHAVFLHWAVNILDLCFLIATANLLSSAPLLEIAVVKDLNGRHCQNYDEKVDRDDDCGINPKGPNRSDVRSCIGEESNGSRT